MGNRHYIKLTDAQVRMMAVVLELMSRPVLLTRDTDTDYVTVSESDIQGSAFQIYESGSLVRIR